METVGSERLETSALGLTFQVKPKYVKHGLKLECTASIGSVYWQSFQDSPKVSPREQPAISGNWWTSSHASSKRVVHKLFENINRILNGKSVKKFGSAKNNIIQHYNIPMLYQNFSTRYLNLYRFSLVMHNLLN